MTKRTDDINAYQRAWRAVHYNVKASDKAKKRELYRSHLAATGIRDRSLLK
jgi:hypothetical protein